MSEDGPRVQICRPGQVAAASRAYGLPVVSDDGYNHAPECFSCQGTANTDTCPRSIALREYSEQFTASVAPPADAIRLSEPFQQPG